MALSSDPTNTAKIEKAWRRENRQRYTRLAKSSMKLFQQIYGTAGFYNAKGDEPTFTTTPDQLDRFMAGITKARDLAIFGVKASILVSDDLSPWVRKYIAASYFTSLMAGGEQLEGAGIDIGFNLDALRELWEIGTDKAKAAALMQANPLHARTVESIQISAMEQLIRDSNNMLNQIRGRMEQSANNNTPTVQVVKQIGERINVANSYGETNATTETIQAYQQGQINMAAIAEQETGETINVRWITMKDDRVRDLHARWHGEVMTKDEASQRKDISPWNCRCGLAQVPPRADTKRRQAKFDRERERLLKARESDAIKPKATSTTATRSSTDEPATFTPDALAQARAERQAKQAELKAKRESIARQREELEAIEKQNRERRQKLDRIKQLQREVRTISKRMDGENVTLERLETLGKRLNDIQAEIDRLRAEIGQ